MQRQRKAERQTETYRDREGEGTLSRECQETAAESAPELARALCAVLGGPPGVRRGGPRGHPGSTSEGLWSQRSRIQVPGLPTDTGTRGGRAQACDVSPSAGPGREPHSGLRGPESRSDGPWAGGLTLPCPLWEGASREHLDGGGAARG